MAEVFANERREPQAGRTACPTEGDLVAFAQGKESPLPPETISEHLASCSSCEQVLKRIELSAGPLDVCPPADMEWPYASEPECRRMQEVAKAIPALLAKAGWEKERGSTASSHLSTYSGAPAQKRAGNDEPTLTRQPALPAIEGYKLQKLLGEGAFGRVYLAEDLELKRPVALKVPRFPIGHRPVLVEEFLNEARTAARLRHPGIVTIYNVGRTGDTCFIAMEYVEGRTLKQVLAEGKPTFERAASFIAQAAAALHYAHKQGLVHRDLKPSNILIDTEDRVRVADFGLAIGEEEQRLQAGELAGTLPYAPPEQVRGEVHRLDGRADIWALGVILYELLTGRRPFRGDTQEIIDQIEHRPPKPPRQIDDTIPAELERICLKCLAKEADQRYSTAKDVGSEIENAIDPPVPPPPLPHSLRLPAIGLACAFVIALAATTVWSIGSFVQQTKPPVSYNVNAAAPFVPVPLAHGDPRPPFPRDESNDDWRVVPAEERVVVDSPSIFLLGLGETTANAYTLKVNISKTGRHGQSGVFLGLKPCLEKSEDWQFEMIGVFCKGPDEFFIQRIEYVAERTGENFGFNSRVVESVPVEAAPLALCQLEVAVRGSRVHEVRWRGQVLAALTDYGKHPPDAAMDTQGQFGVVTIGGNTVFHEPTFRRER
jgi:serine/threonine protein kinase